MIDIEFKSEIWHFGFPTMLRDLAHAKEFASTFPGAIGFRYRGKRWPIKIVK